MMIKGQEKIIHICKLLNADTYINAIGGQDLYDKEAFKQSYIDLKFIKKQILLHTLNSKTNSYLGSLY